MKTISLLASTLALAVTVAAAPAPEFDRRNYFCLQSFEAQLIVNKYISILENKSYLGQSPSSTANQVIAADYVEYSDSILSLEKAAVRNVRPSHSIRHRLIRKDSSAIPRPPHRSSSGSAKSLLTRKWASKRSTSSTAAPRSCGTGTSPV